MIDFDKLLIAEATKYLGTKESAYNDGPMIREFQKAVDGIADRESWCMAFAFYCIKAVEEQTKRKSWLFRSERCMSVWTRSPIESKIKFPEAGALAIWQNYSSTGTPLGTGHVGIVVELLSDQSFRTIEGNTSDSSGLNPDGDGVYKKIRRTAKVGRFRLMGFVRPWMQDPV